MKRIGRPPGRKRTERVEARMTGEELERLDRCAAALGETRTKVINRGVLLVENEITAKGWIKNEEGRGSGAV